MKEVAHMTIAEQLREIARFHEKARADADAKGPVNKQMLYHAQLKDAALRAAAFIETRSIPTGHLPTESARMAETHEVSNDR